MAAPATFHPNPRIITGSNTIFTRLPIIIPIIAIVACPSARIILLSIFPRMRKGIPRATILKYSDAYPIVSLLAPIPRHIDSANTITATIDTTPITSPVQKQKEDICFAISFFPSPSIRLMRDVPPMPNSIPIAMKSRNTGVETDTAATISGFFVWPIKNVSARLYTRTINILTMEGTALYNTALGTGASLKICCVLSLLRISSPLYITKLK